MAGELYYQKVFIDAIEHAGGHAFKASNRFLMGVSDVYAKLPKLRSAWVEAKLRIKPKKIDSFVLDLTALQKDFLKEEVKAGGVGLVLSFMTEPGNKLWAAFYSYNQCAAYKWEARVKDHKLLTNGKREEELVELFKTMMGNYNV